MTIELRRLRRLEVRPRNEVEVWGLTSDVTVTSTIYTVEVEVEAFGAYLMACDGNCHEFKVFANGYDLTFLGYVHQFSTHHATTTLTIETDEIKVSES